MTASRWPPTSAGSTKFDQAIADFAEIYADQNERDYAALQTAVKEGRAETTTDIWAEPDHCRGRRTAASLSVIGARPASTPRQARRCGLGGRGGLLGWFPYQRL